MRSLNHDIDYIKSILKGENEDEFGFIYSRSNENLVALFNKINVTNKKIYSVLSSADFLFSALAEGANSVDCFDLNPITYRYYHLRKWLLQYGLIDADGLSIDDLLHVINRHITSAFIEENDSISFWKEYLSKIDSIHFYSDTLFEYVGRPEVPYSEKIREIVERLINYEPGFDNLDICSKLDHNYNKAYDIIYMSNILDYNREVQKINDACANLLNLLVSRGAVVCSHMVHCGALEVEQDIFSKYFHYDEIFCDEKGVGRVLYYKYTKKD